MQFEMSKLSSSALIDGAANLRSLELPASTVFSNLETNQLVNVVDYMVNSIDY